MGITDQLGLLIDLTVSKIPNIVAVTNNSNFAPKRVKLIVSVNSISGCQKMGSISSKLLLFCYFDFDLKISTKCSYSVYHLFYFEVYCYYIPIFFKEWKV